MVQRWDRRRSCPSNQKRSGEDPLRNLQRDVETALLWNQHHNEILLLQLQCVRLMRNNDSLKLKLEVGEHELWKERERSLHEHQLRLMAEAEVERLQSQRLSHRGLPRDANHLSSGSGTDGEGSEELLATESVLSPALLQLIPESHCDDHGGDLPATFRHDCVGTAQNQEQETPSDIERTKRRPSYCSTQAPDSDQEEDEECTLESLASEALGAKTSTVVGDGESNPSDLHMPDLLRRYLSVPDLLSWRLLSRSTSSREALLAHVAQMGSMDRLCHHGLQRDAGHPSGGSEEIEELLATESVLSPALLQLIPESHCDDHGGDLPATFRHDCVGTAQNQEQETPSDIERTKRRLSYCSTQAPDSDQEEDEECTLESPASEDAGQQPGNDRQASAKSEDGDGRVCIDEGGLSICASESEFTGSKSSSHKHDRARQADASARKEISATMWSYSQTALGGVEVGGGQFNPSDLHMPDLLRYLSVPDLLSWRLLSRSTSSREALLAHVAQMGSMDRPEAVLAFLDRERVWLCTPDLSFEVACDGDAEQQKVFHCQRWHAALASKCNIHFAECYVHHLVGKDLDNLLRHCRSADESVTFAASYLLARRAGDGLPYVQRHIAEAFLMMMEEFHHMGANWKGIVWCIRQIADVLHALSQHQRKNMMSLLVRLLKTAEVSYVCKKPMYHGVMKLWSADDDPSRTFADVLHELGILAESIRDKSLKTAFGRLIAGSS
ncbi:unnamed protein product [Symbiodinium sp. CCMP2592]|nr:unnamed protein product [Symbiodinium sp. CCMP2592]